MPEESGGEKVLPASPQKKRRAREEGNIAKSQDLNSAAALAAALVAMWLLGTHMFTGMAAATRYYLGALLEHGPHRMPLQSLALRAVSDVALCVVPFMLVMLTAGLAINLAQVGFLFTAKPLIPKLDRLNFISGFRKFFTLRTLVELVKSLMKLAVVGALVVMAIRARMDEFPLLMELSPGALVYAVAGMIFSMWWRIVLAMIVIGVLDYGFQWWQREQDLRMTRQEASEELKELEGDPQIKRRIRQLQRQIAMQRMMAEVPKADVIITNPTQYAVALRYDMATMSAPVLVAKGARLLAQRIRDIAAENDVPIVQKPELAQTIYRTLDIGQRIPENLFHAVAEVLSFVYRIDRRAEKIRERQAAWGETHAAAV